jgi:hypothetical protein
MSNAPVSRGQALELVSRFATDTHWDSLEGGRIQQRVIDLPRDELASRFTEFLRNGAPLFPFPPDPKVLECLAALTRDVAIPDIFRLTVDYNLSAEGMIARGSYDRVRNIDEKKFQMNKKGFVEYEGYLFDFKSKPPYEDVVSRIREARPARSWSPAGIEPLLSFGSKYPEEQRKQPIVALGAAGPLGEDAPYLGEEGTDRTLGTGWGGRRRKDPCSYLAVREVQAR